MLNFSRAKLLAAIDVLQRDNSITNAIYSKVGPAALFQQDTVSDGFPKILKSSGHHLGRCIFLNMTQRHLF